MGYSVQDSLIDTGVTFMISLGGGVGAGLYLREGPVALYAFSVATLLILFSFRWYMEKQRDADEESTDENRSEQDDDYLLPSQTTDSPTRYYN